MKRAIAASAILLILATATGTPGFAQTALQCWIETILPHNLILDIANEASGEEAMHHMIARAGHVVPHQRRHR